MRPRLLLTWGLTSGVPMLGVVLLFLDPSNPDGPGELAVVYLVVVALLVGALATLLTARAVGQPLRDLRQAVQRVGEGDYEVAVVVDDAGEIGLLQEVSTGWPRRPGRARALRDLFGRHVGTTVAQRALATGVSLGGEERTVAALFVDIAGSTSLVRRTGPEEMVGCSTASSRWSWTRSRTRAAWSTSSRATLRCASSAHPPTTRTRRCRTPGGPPHL